jgi:SWI/SNF-related matrix-associated actin-dependent regulator 1 of chromatin subfamily A
MIRRLKRDVLKQLPPVTRQVIAIPTELHDLLLAELDEYKQFMSLRISLKALAKTAAKHKDDREFRFKIMTLRDQVRMSFNNLSLLRKRTAVAKIPSVISHLSDTMEETDGKVVVFAHHIEVIEKIHEAFKGVSVAIYGKVDQSKRKDIVDRFQSDPSVRLFVGGLRAAGTGITLTASHHAVFAELDWVPAMLAQSEKRIDRIGQEHPMLIQYVVFDNSLDAYMAKRIVAKQMVIEEAVGDK